MFTYRFLQLAVLAVVTCAFSPSATAQELIRNPTDSEDTAWYYKLVNGNLEEAVLVTPDPADPDQRPFTYRYTSTYIPSGMTCHFGTSKDDIEPIAEISKQYGGVAVRGGAKCSCSLQLVSCSLKGIRISSCSPTMGESKLVGSTTESDYETWYSFWKAQVLASEGAVLPSGEFGKNPFDSVKLPNFCRAPIVPVGDTYVIAESEPFATNDPREVHAMCTPFCEAQDETFARTVAMEHCRSLFSVPPPPTTINGPSRCDYERIVRVEMGGQNREVMDGMRKSSEVRR